MQPVPHDDSDVYRMIEALDSSDWTTRSAATSSLTAMGTRARTALIQQLSGDSVRRAVSAARILSNDHEPQVFDLMKRLVVSENPMLGQIAVEYITRYGGDDCGRYLLSCLKQSSYMVQISIVQALGELGCAEAIEPILDMLQQPEPVGSTLRLMLVTALGAIGDERAIPIVRQFLNDSDDHVSKRARSALAALENVAKT